MFHDPNFTDLPPKALGSVLFVKAASIAEARRFIENDIYYTSGVVRACSPD